MLWLQQLVSKTLFVKKQCLDKRIGIINDI
jgi:hypothetical protein